MATDSQKFDQLSKQRIDYATLPGGGQRARMTITLANGKSFSFVEDITPADIKSYATQIAGVEIGCAMAQGPISGVEVGNIFGDIAKGIGSAVKTVGKVAKKVVTSKVMQTAAKGLAMAAPALGPFAPAALAVSGGIGVAGKLLASKTAQSVGAPRASDALAASAVQDAKALTRSPLATTGLLNIAAKKANSVSNLVSNVVNNAISKATGTDVLAAARLGKVRSNTGGAVTADQLAKAAGAGRLFFLAA
jgi:hypothetical protein